MTSELLLKLEEEKKKEKELRDKVMKQREAEILVSLRTIITNETNLKHF